MTTIRKIYKFALRCTPMSWGEKVEGYSSLPAVMRQLNKRVANAIVKLVHKTLNEYQRLTALERQQNF